MHIDVYEIRIEYNIIMYYPLRTSRLISVTDCNKTSSLVLSRCTLQPHSVLFINNTCYPVVSSTIM